MTATFTTSADVAGMALQMAEVRTWSTARLVEYIGGFSNPSKMPGKSWGTPAVDCQTGGRLREKEGTTCQHCYAMKGAYVWRTVAAAYRRRADRAGLPLWSAAIATVLNRRVGRTVNGDVFRWQDSGDIQSVDQLRRIVLVALATPDVDHWLPTREYRYVQEYVDLYGPFPANLTVRLSAHIIGGHVPTFPRLQGSGVVVSTVSPHGMEGAHQCPAPSQGGHCDGASVGGVDCRACWSRDVPHVDYVVH